MSTGKAVDVYHFTKGDNTGTNVLSKYKATSKAIADFEAVIVPGTAETIDASLLDGHGRYIPK